MPKRSDSLKVHKSIKIGTGKTSFWLHLNKSGLVVNACSHVARLFVNGLVPNHKRITQGGTAKYYRLGQHQVENFQQPVTEVRIAR